MKSDIISTIMDNVLSSVPVANECSSVMVENVVKVLHMLQMEQQSTLLSHDGFVKLLNICTYYNSDGLDELLLNVLQSLISTNSVSSSENRQCLANIADELCAVDSSWTKLCGGLILDHHHDVLSLINTATLADWITHPSSVRVRLTELMISHSKEHMKYFTATGIEILCEAVANVSENIQLFLPLIKSYVQVKDGK